MVEYCDLYLHVNNANITPHDIIIEVSMGLMCITKYYI